MSKDKILLMNTKRDYLREGYIPKPDNEINEEEKKEIFRLIISEKEFEFENDQTVKFVYYGERHVNNGSLRLFVGGEEFLFDSEQVKDLREFLEGSE